MLLGLFDLGSRTSHRPRGYKGAAPALTTGSLELVANCDRNAELGVHDDVESSSPALLT